MSDTLHIVVMRKLIERLGDATNGTHQWLCNETREQLDARARAIADVRLWVRGLPDKRLRGEYLNWLDFWQNGLRDAYNELENHKIQDGQIRFRQRLESDYRAVNEYESSNEIPVPPMSKN
jgi:hypothetical protein